MMINTIFKIILEHQWNDLSLSRDSRMIFVPVHDFE